MGQFDDLLDAQLEEEGQESGLFRRVTQPIRSLFGVTGGAGGYLAGLLDPEAYERAQAANQQAVGGEGTLREAEALPGAGDVIYESIQPESPWAKAGATALRFAGNIAGDPTSYVGVGAIPKVAKLFGGAKAGSKLAALEELGRPGVAGEALRSAYQAAGAGQGFQAFKSLGRAGAAAPFGSVAGAVYGPDLLESLGTGPSLAGAAGAVAGALTGKGGMGRALAGGAGGAGLAGAAFGEEEGLSESLAAGTQDALVAGLGVLLGRGLITEAQAAGFMSGYTPASRAQAPPVQQAAQTPAPQSVPSPPTPAVASVPPPVAPVVAPEPPRVEVPPVEPVAARVETPGLEAERLPDVESVEDLAKQGPETFFKDEGEVPPAEPTPVPRPEPPPVLPGPAGAAVVPAVEPAAGTYDLSSIPDPEAVLARIEARKAAQPKKEPPTQHEVIPFPAQKVEAPTEIPPVKMEVPITKTEQPAAPSPVPAQPKAPLEPLTPQQATLVEAFTGMAEKIARKGAKMGRGEYTDLLSRAHEALVDAARTYSGKGPFEHRAASFISKAMLQEGRVKARSQKRNVGLEAKPEGGKAPVDTLVAPEPTVPRADQQAPLLEKVQKILQGMDPRWSSIFTANVVEGKPLKEIAKQFNVSDEAVRKLRNKAIMKLVTEGAITEDQAKAMVKERAEKPVEAPAAKPEGPLPEIGQLDPKAYGQQYKDQVESHLASLKGNKAGLVELAGKLGKTYTPEQLSRLSAQNAAESIRRHLGIGGEIPGRIKPIPPKVEAKPGVLVREQLPAPVKTKEQLIAERSAAPVQKAESAPVVEGKKEALKPLDVDVKGIDPKELDFDSNPKPRREWKAAIGDVEVQGIYRLSMDESPLITIRAISGAVDKAAEALAALLRHVAPAGPKVVFADDMTALKLKLRDSGLIRAIGATAGKSAPPNTYGIYDPNFLGLKTSADLISKMAKAGFSTGKDALSHGLDLMKRKVRDIDKWSSQMVREFGGSVKRFLSEIYNTISRYWKEHIKPVPGGRPSEAGVLRWGKGRQGTPSDVEASLKANEEIKPPETDPVVALKVLAGLPEGTDISNAKPQGDPDIGYNVLRNEISEEGAKNAVNLFQALNEGLARGTKRPWAQVEQDMLEMAGQIPPAEFISKLIKSGANLSDTQIAYIDRILNSELEEMTKARAKFLEALEADADDIDRILDDGLAAIGRSVLVGQVAANLGGTGPARALTYRRALKGGIDPGLKKEARVSAALTAAGVAKDLRPGLVQAYMQGEWDKFQAGLHNALKPTVLEKILFGWKAMLLTPQSIIANAGSNEIISRMRDLEKHVLAPEIDKLRVKFLGGERSVHHIPWNMFVASESEAWREAWPRLIDEISKTVKGQPLEPTNLGGSKDIDIRRASHPLKHKKLGEYLGAPFKFLEAGDSFYKVRSVFRELTSRAYAMAVKEAGKEGPDAVRIATEKIIPDMQRAATYISNGQPIPKELKKYIKPWAKIETAMKRDTLQAELEGFFRTMGHAINDHKMIQFAVPFYKTPVNVMLETVRRTPLGFALALKKLAQKQLEPEDLADELARPLLGTTIMAGVYLMGLSGAMTGGGPTDPDKLELQKSTGWQPYSFKFGDQYISYQRMEPFSSILGMAADWSEGVQRGEFSDASKASERVFSSIAENLTNKTFLSGLEGIFTAWHDPKRYAGRLAKQLQGTMVPNNIAMVPFGSLARALDPVYRQTEAFTADPWIAKIPGASQTLPAQTVPGGAVRERTGSFSERLISPFYRSVEKHTPEADVARELVRIGYPPTSPRKYITIGGKKVELELGEVQQLQEAQRKATSAIHRVIKDPTYLALPDNEEDPRFKPGRKTKKDVLESIYRRHRQAVQAGINQKAYKRAFSPNQASADTL